MPLGIASSSRLASGQNHLRIWATRLRRLSDAGACNLRRRREGDKRKRATASPATSHRSLVAANRARGLGERTAEAGARGRVGFA